MKILVIDDDEMILKVLSAKLSNIGHTVTTAPEAETALVSMSKNKPDLIISDVMMPYMSGLELLNIVNHQYLDGIPVILMSALQNDEVISLSMSLGAKDYVLKPINFYQLMPTIRRIAC